MLRLVAACTCTGAWLRVDVAESTALANRSKMWWLAPFRWWARRPWALRWGAVVAEMGLLWWLSSRQIDSFGTGILRALLHNGAHVVAYGALGVFALLALRGTRQVGGGTDAMRAVCIAAAYGVVDELHQRCVPGRVCSLADLGADISGAVFGVATVLGLVTADRRWVWRAAVAAACAMAAVALATFTDW